MSVWEEESVESLQDRHSNAVTMVSVNRRLLAAAVRSESILAACTAWALAHPGGRLDPTAAAATYDAAQMQP